MLPEVDKAGFTPIEIPKPRRNIWAAVKIVAAVLVVGGAAVAWMSGYRPPLLQASTRPSFLLAEVDRGDVDLYVVETGTIESAFNTTVRCEVEALMGVVGGSQASGKSGTSSSSSQGASGSSAQGASGSGTASGTTTSKTTKKTGTTSSSSTAKTGTTTGSTSGSSSSKSSSSSSSGGSTSGSSSGSGGSGGSGGSAASSSSTSSSALTKPTLRSFSYTVAPYQPARPATPKAQESTQKKTDQSQGKGGGGGGRGGGGGGGGGRRGGGGGFGQDEEKAGSTRIVWITPEGTRVKAGEVLGQLDKSAFEEEERTQRIRYLQAQSYVDQAESMLEVAKITLREYRDGIYPQDLQLIRQYIDSCKIARDRAAGNYEWSQAMLKLNFRTPFQVKGDKLSLEQTEVALQEAQGMLLRLTQFTAPKIIKTLEANVAAIDADLLTQKASFSFEEQRLRRLQKNIANCTIKAPGDGIVVYANQADWRGVNTTAIDEGVTVREKQPLINLPDPQRMRVRAKINETKVALVRTGEHVRILVDAFPNRPLEGVVGDVTAISIPIRGSDVRVYYANIDITKGFDELRPGLSAEVFIDVERHPDVTRVPVDAIRWTGGVPYVALYEGSREKSGQPPWSWRKIEVGLSDPTFVEVVHGLEPGDRVIAYPGNLPAPAPEKLVNR